jgi:hypothetical protein
VIIDIRPEGGRDRIGRLDAAKQIVVDQGAVLQAEARIAGGMLALQPFVNFLQFPR